MIKGRGKQKWSMRDHLGCHHFPLATLPPQLLHAVLCLSAIPFQGTGMGAAAFLLLRELSFSHANTCCVLFCLHDVTRHSATYHCPRPMLRLIIGVGTGSGALFHHKTKLYVANESCTNESCLHILFAVWTLEGSIYPSVLIVVATKTICPFGNL